MARVFHRWITCDGEEGGSAPRDAIFPWWSFTKTVVAACAMRLAARGIVDLDARDRDTRATLRQMLRHVAGFGDYGGLPDYHAAVSRREDAWPFETLLDRASGRRRGDPSRPGWRYSNIGYLHARRIMERVTGLPLAILLRTELLDPMQLAATRLATARSDSATLFWPELRDYDPNWVYHGCLYGPVRDAARLLHALVTEDPATWRAMCDGLDLGGALQGRPWTTTAYGIGTMCGMAGRAGRAQGHSGAGPGATNAVYHFPDLPRPVTVAAFCDASHEALAEWTAHDVALLVQRGQEKPGLGLDESGALS